MGDALRGAMPSLRRVLLVWLLVPLLVLVPLSAALIYTLALRPALDGLDRALADTVVALSRIVEARDGRVALPLLEQTARVLQADLVDEIYFAVGDDAGHRLEGDAELLQLAPRLAGGDWRFFDASLRGRAVRVSAHGSACGQGPAQVCPILVAETLGKRHAAQRAVLLAALAGGVTLALPLVALALLAVDRGMRPLRRAAAEVASRTPDRLEPVDLRAMPREVHGFVHAINGLFARLRDAAASQRSFVADAAHQLRTPLAVLRVEAEQALATPHPEALHPALQRLHAAAERGSRLAQQLLVLARTEGSALDAAGRRERVELGQLATAAADTWLHASLAAGQDLGFELAPAWVEGDPLLLEELLGNLIHNAIEHAGPGARVTVRTHSDDALALLCVEDDGRGIATEERDTVWQRFRRGRAASGSGSGLGLAIVQDIAALHQARAALDAGASGRGLRATVSFPAARPDAAQTTGPRPPASTR